MMLVFRGAAVAFAVLTLPLSPAALAQEYPTKPIRIIVGPGPDVLSRIIGQKFTDAWGQQAVIDQRPGAGGTISAEITARATPDGYTLLMMTSAYTINVVLQPSSYASLTIAILPSLSLSLSSYRSHNDLGDVHHPHMVSGFLRGLGKIVLAPGAGGDEHFGAYVPDFFQPVLR